MERTELVRFLSEGLAVDLTAVDDATPLFSSGLIDSFALVELLAYLDERCGFKVKPGDVDLDNLDSIGRILAFVERSAPAA